jgi:hypothetical protein
MNQIGLLRPTKHAAIAHCRVDGLVGGDREKPGPTLLTGTMREESGGGRAEIALAR